MASHVYDIFQPTPAPLKELSAITVSLEVWRYKVNEYRSNVEKLRDFCPSGERILSQTMLPDLPTVIYTVIDKYIRRYGRSMENWLKEHHSRIFYFYIEHRNSILKYFHDFVCDYAGAIDYLRTAERMMHCDGFDENQKFMIACTYFFEDDIRQLWPLVYENVTLKNIVFSKSPQSYYWICCLRRDFHNIAIACGEINDTVVEGMLNRFMSLNRPSVEYFWNELPSEKRTQNAISVFWRDALSFVRFILPKLNDQQLEEFVNENSYKLMSALVKNAWYDKDLILSTWMYIKKAMNANTFANMAFRMLRSELLDSIARHNPKCWFYFCREIWNDAPENWKRSAIVNIISDTRLFEGCRDSLTMPLLLRHFELLPIFLSFAPYEMRNRFWFDKWKLLIIHAYCEDLSKIMKLCFENEEEIAQFKQNVMAQDDTVLRMCREFQIRLQVDKLNDLVSFLFSEEQAARNFKQQLLHSAFIREDTELKWIIREGKKFCEYVDDVYADDVDLCKDFKDQLLSSSEIQERLSRSALSAYSEVLIEFIESFATEEEILLQIKTRIIDTLKKEAATNNSGKSSISDFNTTTLLSWCLGSYEEVVEFKMIYS